MSTYWLDDDECIEGHTFDAANHAEAWDQAAEYMREHFPDADAIKSMSELPLADLRVRLPDERLRKVETRSWDGRKWLTNGPPPGGTPARRR